MQGGSPNFGLRRDGLTPTLVVLHYTAMASADSARTRLCDPAAEVSAHYLIARSGEVLPLVAEDMRAWHAGAGTWRGQDDINSRSIGIELDNDGQSPFSEPLMAALEELLAAILTRWGIPPEGVIGHSDMAPTRKYDPGPRFDWPRLVRCSLAAPYGGRYSGPVDEDAFRHAARACGYPENVPTEDLLRAVRFRHRPWARGPLAAQDIAVLQPM